MLFQVPDVGNMLQDIWKEIDSGKAGLIIYIIGTKGNRQPSTLFHARFQVGY